MLWTVQPAETFSLLLRGGRDPDAELTECPILALRHTGVKTKWFSGAQQLWDAAFEAAARGR